MAATAKATSPSCRPASHSRSRSHAMTPAGLPELKYILLNRQPEPCPDLFVWAKWYENFKNRSVQHDEVIGPNTTDKLWMGLQGIAIGLLLVISAMAWAEPELGMYLVFLLFALPAHHPPAQHHTATRLELRRCLDCLPWPRPQLRPRPAAALRNHDLWWPLRRLPAPLPHLGRGRKRPPGNSRSTHEGARSKPR